MSKRNRLAGLILVSALLAGPALADGRERPPVQTPPPLVPHAGCADLSDLRGGCHVQVQPQQHIIRRIVSAPPARAAFSYDFSGFDGGVGANVGGGYGGGGGVIVISSGQRFSGVLSHPAAHIRFHGHGGKSCGGCGH